ncbi:MAG: hypothetical protein FWE45_00330 [Firmicutes bacterium]|nr:hypothetical protein [Bacillota bacterium]
MEIITFWSYKGGAGRSSTCLNTLPYLVDVLNATKQSPLLLLDMDLDSAGMTYLLDLDKHFQNNEVYDIKSFLKGDENWSENPAESLMEHTLYQKFVPVGEKLGVDNDAVMFLGVHDGKKIDNADMTGAKEEIFAKFRRFCRKNKISAVVMDSSAGTQFSAELAIGAATIVVSCMRATTQFRTGTFNYLDRLLVEQPDKKIIVLPTVVPNGEKIIDDMPQRKTTVEDIKKKIETFGLKNVKLDFVEEEELGINEVERFKWREGVLYKICKDQKLAEDEKIAVSRYKKLAEKLVEGDYD